MFDTSSLRASVEHTTRIEVAGSQVKTGEILSSEITAFSCVEHPEHRWRGWQWENVLEHLIREHSGASEENGSGADAQPFLDQLRTSEHVSVGLEPPADSEGDPGPEVSA